MTTVSWNFVESVRCITLFWKPGIINPIEAGALDRVPIKPKKNTVLHSTLAVRSARNKPYLQLYINTLKRVAELGERGANLNPFFPTSTSTRFHMRSDKWAGISPPVGCCGYVEKEGMRFTQCWVFCKASQPSEVGSSIEEMNLLDIEGVICNIVHCWCPGLAGSSCGDTSFLNLFVW